MFDSSVYNADNISRTTSCLGEAHTVKDLNERSKELCPNGYTVMNQEAHDEKNWAGNPVGKEEVTRKIKCYSAE